eukprot:PLAT9833.1.p1 GENE.PLAT9833.1~~PLAT9833.1.p1  ORF type:complete len:655 (-),score=304.81 PLAT9833.1:25-1740(-)
MPEAEESDSAAVKRQLMLFRLAGGLPKDEHKRKQLLALVGDMESAYSTSKVNGAPLDPVLAHTMASSRNVTQLREAWEGWHDVAGGAVGRLYPSYVRLSNVGARDYGFADAGELWRSGYDMPASEVEGWVSKLWRQLQPLYEQLHCYTRAKLVEAYGASVVPPKGALPAHVMGNMWAQSWSNIARLVKPFPHAQSPDVTAAMRQQAYDAERMHRLSESFYKSLGLQSLPASYWQRSMLVRPQGRDVVCHASAWTVSSPTDVRIKMCTAVTEEDLYVVHHEQGHLYYDLAYAGQPYLFRDGANDGVHEAIGDTTRLSVETARHLAAIGLLRNSSASTASTVNFQMAVALDKVAFLPFALVMDTWRWQVFSGQVQPQQYNELWWNLKQRYQGVVPPRARPPHAFDPGAKYHIAADVPYLRYFLAYVMQFQFHRALCRAAGWRGALHECSIYNSTAAGDRFEAMLRLGRSKPWQEALFVLDGTRQLDAGAMLEYFAPLREFLQEATQNMTCGWPQPPPLQHGLPRMAIAVLAVLLTGAVVAVAYWLRMQYQRRQRAAGGAGGKWTEMSTPDSSA